MAKAYTLHVGIGIERSSMEYMYSMDGVPTIGKTHSHYLIRR